MRRTSKLNSILEQLNHPDLDNILLVVEESKPSIFPSKQEVEALIFDSFLDECERFLSQQYRFHQFSKKITSRATEIINEIDKIERYNKVAAKPQVESQIERILTKTELNAGREECLSKILDHLQIPDQMVKKIADPGAPVDEAFFEAVQHLEKQKLLITTLQSFGDSRLIESIKKSHGSLLNMAVSKTIKSLGKLSQITNIQLLKKYKEILKDSQENRKKFEEGVLNSRRQVNKNYFNPIISQLNYSLKKPVEEYYLDIFSEILKRFNEERQFLQQLFPETKSKLLSELMTSFVPDVYFRLERCFFKAMQPLPLCKIKVEYLSYYKKLRQLLGTLQYKSIHIEASLAKLDQCIESVVKTQAQKMTKTKYNIYSVAGYVGIAETLKTLYEAYLLDEKNQRWVEPFYRLVQSRVPTQLNKSLVIFSINIWEIYLKIFGEQGEIEIQKENMYQKAVAAIQKGCQMFQSMNQKDFIQKILQGAVEIPKNEKKVLEYILSLCSADPKKILHSELTLIIHQNLRSKIKGELNEFMMKYYRQMLEVVAPMNNQELKAKCLECGINIKSLGRSADTVYAPTEAEMLALIQ